MGRCRADYGGGKAGGLKSLDNTLLEARAVTSGQLSFHLRGSQSLLSQKHSRVLGSKCGLEMPQATLRACLQEFSCGPAGRKEEKLSFGPRSHL